MNWISNLVLKYFYIGNFQYAPGSLSSLFAALVWFFIPDSMLFKLLFLLIHLLMGFYFCYLFYSTRPIDKDPSFIVIDEVVGMMISLYLAPKIFSAYLMAFILFRFFDILKPSIIDRAQYVNYGIGIMLDDIISGFLSLLIVYGIFY
ncbi:MAG: phosphatidylglycerophosphatase A [Candidatus Marinimicrobia bacterium]|nr:phosphatidylglycerophosphatase A [Candidatus Neomarinimicrobiota bacterium]|tara:strand:- start:37482 stop:37922 length:441 start_codon:yes stop_codon:yes gene_type:complete